MKRPDQRSQRSVQPVRRYLEHERYPAVECDDTGALDELKELEELENVSRREFLGRAAASATVLGAAGVGLTARSPEGRAAGKGGDNRYKVSLSLGRQRLGNSTMSVRQVILWTADKKLASWLRSYSNRRGVTGVFSPILRKTTEKVLVDGKKIYHLERKLGAALVRHYRKKTGRHASQPDLMIILGRHWRPRLRGAIVRPTFRPRPRPRP